MQLDDSKQVIIRTLSDIKEAIGEFLPTSRPSNPDVAATIRDGDKSYRVSAKTGCTYYDMLHEGFEMVRRRMDAINKYGTMAVNVSGNMWLDKLIKSRLGGSRDGLRIKWEISEGIFYFDPFSGVLSKRNASDS